MCVLMRPAQPQDLYSQTLKIYHAKVLQGSLTGNDLPKPLEDFLT